MSNHGEGGTMRKLAADWASFVRQVETGYDDSIYDYTNDLSVRDLLEDQIRLLAPAEAQAAREGLRPWDLRFEAATRPVLRAVAPGVTDRGRSWWFRAPVKLSGELAEDLRSEGMIE